MKTWSDTQHMVDRDRSRPRCEKYVSSNLAVVVVAVG
jgi:hypothetical protein